MSGRSKRARSAAEVYSEEYSDAIAADAAETVALVLSGGQVWPAGIVLQRQQQLLCDAELNVEGTEFYAHRCVLAVGSTFFKGLYTGGTPLKNGPYALDEVSPLTFEAVLTWLYEGSCALVTQDGLVPLLEAAGMLGVLPLRDAVVAAIIERLTPDSCVGAWGLASRHSLPSLADAARSVCLESFGALLAGGTLGALSATCLGELLAHDELAVANEEMTFAAIKCWLDAQETEPAEDVVASLVRHIRFERMNEVEVERDRIADEPLMQKLALMTILARTAHGTRRARPLKECNLRIMSQDGNEFKFKLKVTTPLQKLVHAFCNVRGIPYATYPLNGPWAGRTHPLPIRFLFDGSRINETQTPEELGMEDGDVIDVMVEQQGFLPWNADPVAVPAAGDALLLHATHAAALSPAEVTALVATASGPHAKPGRQEVVESRSLLSAAQCKALVTAAECEGAS